MPATVGQSKAQITVLYDAFGKKSPMQKDWGYAAFIEYGGKRILFDTGNNPIILARNARAKGIDLTKLDFVVMSHRHGDHMGGLSYVLKVNPRVKIYAPKEGIRRIRGGLTQHFLSQGPWPADRATILWRRTTGDHAVRFRLARCEFSTRGQNHRDRAQI